MKRVAVIGAGLMGSGIAYACARAGYEVVVVDAFAGALEKAKQNHQRWLAKELGQGKCPKEEADERMARVSWSQKIADCAGAELVVEAVVEELKVKQEVFRSLDEVLPAEAVIGSNTSSLPITTLAESVRDPGRVVGIHFFNPAHVMRLVEIIRGLKTRDEVAQRAVDFSKSLGKEITESADTPGFITSRFGAVCMNEAIFLLQEGIGTREDIDKAIKLGYNHPMGPLQLADLIGLDTLLHVLEVLWEGYQDPKYRPAYLLKQMVAAGKLGRKTGEGFYTYGSS